MKNFLIFYFQSYQYKNFGSNYLLEIVQERLILCLIISPVGKVSFVTESLRGGVFANSFVHSPLAACNSLKLLIYKLHLY